MPLFTGISLLNRAETLALIDSLSISLSNGLNTEDVNTLGNLLVAAGSVMLTFGSLTSASSKISNSSNESKDIDAH